MKKSKKMEGLGQIPEHWGVMELGRIGTFVRGSGLTKADLQAEGVGAIHYGQIHTYYNTHTTQTKSFISPALARRLKKARHGNLIITGVSEDIEGVCKAVAYLGKADICISGDIFAYSHKQDPKYIAYAFQTDYFSRLKAKYANGVKVMRVKLENLKNFKIPLPPLEEQHAIASLLDNKIAKIQECITKKTRMTELLKEYKQALITQIATKGLDPQAKLKPSGVAWLEDIPEGWGVVKLKYLVKKIRSGGTPKTSVPKFWTSSKEKGFLWVAIEDMKSSTIEDTRRYITQEGLNASSAHLVPPFSVLYSIYASLGKVAYSTQELTTNQAILAIEPNDKCFYKFLFYYLHSMEQIIKSFASMTTQNNLSLAIVKDLVIPLPPLKEQHAIASLLDEKTAKIDSLLAKLQAQIQTLKEHKSALISAGVLGQLHLKANHAKIQ
ncbi:restriction endonuclease subunit S [Helicobacter felis]|uniref:restriction endonuclease subunit S n=1 Tax=Helicobacter felis TaxID=214 RepID=UPI000CF109F5|nr:restriction endonuclease subunit S [Helicobacter felis]